MARFIHDDDQRRIAAIVCGEGSAVEQAQAHRAEVIALGKGKARKFQLPLVRGLIVDGVSSLW